MAMASPSNDDGGKNKESVVDLSREFACPICLMVITRTRTVMECLHRFCGECIDKAMRVGNNECPVCRIHLSSRRALRDDPKFDKLIAAFYPHVESAATEEEVFDLRMKELAKAQQENRMRIMERQSMALGKRMRAEAAAAVGGEALPQTSGQQPGQQMPGQQVPGGGDGEAEPSSARQRLLQNTGGEEGGGDGQEGGSESEGPSSKSPPSGTHTNGARTMRSPASSEIDFSFLEHEMQQARVIAQARAMAGDPELSAREQRLLRVHLDFEAANKPVRAMSVRVALWPLFDSIPKPGNELPWILNPHHHFHSTEYVLSLKNYVAAAIDVGPECLEIFLGSRHPLEADLLMSKLEQHRTSSDKNQDEAKRGGQEEGGEGSSSDDLSIGEVWIVPGWPTCFEAPGWAEEGRVVGAFEGSPQKRKGGVLQLVLLKQAGVRVGTLWEDFFDKNSTHMAVYYRLKEGQKATRGQLAGLLEWADENM